MSYFVSIAYRDGSFEEVGNFSSGHAAWDYIRGFEQSYGVYINPKVRDMTVGKDA